MSAVTPIELRRATIQTLRTRVARLMREAQHESLKAVLGLANEQLDQASDFLDQPTINSDSAGLAIVDRAIHQAANHLQMAVTTMITADPHTSSR